MNYGLGTKLEVKGLGFTIIEGVHMVRVLLFSQVLETFVVFQMTIHSKCAR